MGESRLSSSSLIIKVSERAIRARGEGRASKKVSQSPGMRRREARGGRVLLRDFKSYPCGPL